MSRIVREIGPQQCADPRESFINKLTSEANVSVGNYVSSDALSVRTIFEGMGAELILIDKI